MKSALTILVVLAGVAVMPSTAGATKYEAEKDGHAVVAHTSRAPVVVHKIFPPYGLHKHVYAGSLKKDNPDRSEARR